MINCVPILINAAALIYGGVVDFKRREIPNTIPLLLLVSGFLSFSRLWRIIGLIIPAALLLMAAKLTKSEIPRRRFKAVVHPRLCLRTAGAGGNSSSGRDWFFSVWLFQASAVKTAYSTVFLCRPCLYCPPHYLSCVGGRWEHVKIKR